MPRPGESVVDWLVRAGLASDPTTAAEGLAVTVGLERLLDALGFLANPTQQSCRHVVPEAQDLPAVAGQELTQAVTRLPP